MAPHICHISTAHSPFDSRIFKRACVSLAEAGFRVTFLCQHPREETAEGVRLVPLPIARNKAVRRLWVTAQAGRLAESLHADLYHFHDPELIPAMRRLARRISAPVVWDAHENFVHSIRHYNQLRLSPLSHLAARYFDRLELAACRSEFAGVVTVTEHMARRYRENAIPACVVGNCIDGGKIDTQPRAGRSQLPRIISTATQSTERLVCEVADAYALARRNVPLQLAFWGRFDPPNLRDELQSRALKHGAPPCDLLISGPHSWDTLVRDLTPTGWCSCVLMNTSNRNNCVGLPNRLFESWANCVPVIANRGTEVARVVEAVGGGFIVEEPTAEHIARVFEQVARNPGLIEAKGMAGRRAVEGPYSWGSAFKNLLSFYEQLGIGAPKARLNTANELRQAS